MATSTPATLDPKTDKPPRRRRWIPLSVRLFAGILLLVGLGGSLWFGLAVHRQSTAIREIEHLGGVCVTTRIGPKWLDRFFESPLSEVTVVRVSRVDEIGEIIPHFHRLHPRPRLYFDFTQIHVVGSKRMAEKVEGLLNRYPILIHSCGRDGETPLQHAASQMVEAQDPEARDKWLRITKLCRGHGAEYDLLTAIYLNDLDRVRAILKEFPNYVDDFQDRSPLRTAAEAGSFEICRHLIETHHVDVDDFTRGEGYPIIISCMSHPRIAELLIRNGADIRDESDNSGSRSKTALHCAAFWERAEIAKLLIDAGTDVNAIDRFGGTPLDDALDMDHADLVQLLREHGGVPGKQEEQ